ncbi:hypothetical protein LZ554_002639 [Drepanopeziza brunnea f. sp. 'monogermtubi']|nr:hypothetical protein LZ554_002639 [Drepanopeziza brunnea f. sp. 'monogermtubi']
MAAAVPVTEIAYITLKPGIELEGSGAAAQAWKETLTTVSQQDGYQRMHWGRTLEDPNQLMLFIDWDSRDAHLKFVATPGYTPFKNRLGTIMEGVHLHHVAFSPFPPSILGRAPVIEFATFFGTSDVFLSHVEKFMGAAGKPEGYHGSVYGPSVEDDVGKHADGGDKGKAVVLLIGWDSVEAHTKFRETEGFQKNIGLLEDGAKGAEVVHVAFTAV